MAGKKFIWKNRKYKEGKVEIRTSQSKLPLKKTGHPLMLDNTIDE